MDTLHDTVHGVICDPIRAGAALNYCDAYCVNLYRLDGLFDHAEGCYFSQLSHRKRSFQQ
jgi:hypothetical protein